MLNGLFRKNKTSRTYVLESENAELLSKIKDLESKNAELQHIIDNNGYKVPEVKMLHFINQNKWLVHNHYNNVINAMNATGIEIVSANIDETDKGWGNVDTWFRIKYILPQNMKSVSFAYSYINNTYNSNFDFKYF